MSTHDDDEIDNIDNYDCYGQTPPRTRISRKIRERKQRDSYGTSGLKNLPKMVRPDKRNISRRNTVSFMYDELLAKAEISENNSTEQIVKRADKRSMKLQRGSERDLKLDIGLAQNFNSQPESKETVPDLLPPPPSTPQPSVQVESSKQFKSLASKRVAPLNRRQARSVSGSFANGDLSFIKRCPPSRIEFHRTFGVLINMGVQRDKGSGNDQRPPRKHISKEEALWQLEIKDLIWLELQAYHAGRTTVDEDNYICIARECIGSLLNEIMMYKFRRKKKRVSVTSQDSGVESDDCSGCLSMFCTSCLEAQNDALREVEELMQRLEKVEGLFMSSKAFAEVYPLYKSPEFVGRVKAMCLWYNMMKHQRLKLAILGRMLAFLENKYFHWPTTISYDGCSADSTSPSDSNSSNSSVDYLVDKAPLDIYAHQLFLTNKSMDLKTNPYRKYIENILKTRGLNKSMQFLEKLHTDILMRAQITLERPGDTEIFINSTSNLTEDDHDLELIRYGCHSPEAKSLDLPSYKAVFLYLSTVPLKVIHEFLLMRLEQKPKNPSPLSIRQLTRELKDGIRIATRHRDRVLTNYHVALSGSSKDAKEFYVQSLDSFDDTLQEVFKDYLEYLEEWALLQHDNFQKNLLEEEWKFIVEVAPSIQGPDLKRLGWQLAMKKMTSILCKLMSGIGERLMERLDEIQIEIQHEEDDDVNQKNMFLGMLRELQGVFKDEREMVAKTMAFARTVLKNNTHHLNIDIIEDFKHQYVQLKCLIANAIEKAQVMCDSLPMEHLDDAEKMTLIARCREILLQGYKFGFEFYKEMSEFIPKDAREKLSRSMIQFAKLWMKFTMERCERGRGRRPRWAYQGLDFLLTVCEPQNTMYLTDEEFDDLKKSMDACISHVIGSMTPDVHTPKLMLEFTRSQSLRGRGSSPSTRTPPYKTQRSNNRKQSVESSPEKSPRISNGPKCVSLSEGLEKANKKSTVRQERLMAAVNELEESLDKKLKEAELIGTVMNCPKEANHKAHIRRRHVTFTWQRGIKIGQGRFGKVYTAVNNTTGEMMAMKEISLQPNDVVTIRKVTEEIKILEGINHRNIVRYYGLEVHKEEMLIFMEFCPEGTLESLVAGTENGLPEILIRKYTYQLTCGVAVLHEHGIVHRDIKTANIFLADEGNCLKIGDFGCAVKIKSHTTMPGELQGFIGTQAYMAPEMFMKTQVNGHGRAADIWSVGCVVVEMATGKRPWAEFDSNYQIMFRVGMGDRPEAPENLIDEGHDFLNRCLQHNAKERATAAELLQHNFVKIGEEE
nr:mitogen-activated protein kinase kinase kinase 4 [Onthophagus taurus]